MGNAKEQLTENPVTVGHIYYVMGGTGFAVVTGIEDYMVKALALSNGKRISASRAAFAGDGRPATKEEQATIANWEEQWTRAKAPRDHFNPGQVVTLDKRVHAAAAKAGMAPAGKYVVIKVSEKSVNVVPLGGHGDGSSYLRVDGRLLTTAEAE